MELGGHAVLAPEYISTALADTSSHSHLITESAIMTADTKLTLGCLIPISDSKLAELQSVANVHYWPDGKDVDRSKFPDIDVLFGIPDGVKDLSELPRLKHVQLCSSGSDGGQNWPPMAAVKNGERDVSLSTASGAHALTIPNYVTAMVLNIYHQIPKQILNAREKRTWTKDIDVYGRTYGIRQTRGRTAGLLVSDSSAFLLAYFRSEEEVGVQLTPRDTAAWAVSLRVSSRRSGSASLRPTPRAALGDRTGTSPPAAAMSRARSPRSTTQLRTRSRSRTSWGSAMCSLRRCLIHRRRGGS